MTSLKKDIKARILQNALDAAPASKRLEELSAMKIQLAVDIYDSVTDGHNHEEYFTYFTRLKSVIEKSPFCAEAYVKSLKDNQVCGFLCTFGELRYYLDFPQDGTTRYRIKSELLHFAEDHEFSIKLNKISQEAQKCRVEINNLNIDIMTILDSCRTVAQLKKSWPASINFLEGCEVCAELKSDPAVIVSDLNAKLGIYK